MRQIGGCYAVQFAHLTSMLWHKSIWFFFVVRDSCVVCVCGDVRNVLCCVFVLFFFVLLPVSLDCPFLIASLVPSNVYLKIPKGHSKDINQRTYNTMVKRTFLGVMMATSIFWFAVYDFFNRYFIYQGFSISLLDETELLLKT